MKDAMLWLVSTFVVAAFTYYLGFKYGYEAGACDGIQDRKQYSACLESKR